MTIPSKTLGLRHSDSFQGEIWNVAFWKEISFRTSIFDTQKLVIIGYTRKLIISLRAEDYYPKTIELRTNVEWVPVLFHNIPLEGKQRKL